jgi:ribose transport system substrate-binding protein
MPKPRHVAQTTIGLACASAIILAGCAGGASASTEKKGLATLPTRGIIAASATSGSELAGESSHSAPAAGSSKRKAPSAGSAKGKTFVYVASANGDTIYGTIACGAKAEAKRLGATYELDTIGATYAAPAQISTLNAASATNPSGIMVSPMDPNALYEPIKAVVARDIPVVTVDNQVANPDQVASQVLVNNSASGVLAADYFAKRAAGRHVQVALLTIPLGLDIASDDEDRGFAHELKKYPNITYVGATYANVVLSDNVSATNAILARDPHLFGIFGTQQFADDGAVVGAAQSGAHPVIVAGYGGEDDALVTDLRKGTIAAMTDYPLAKVGAMSIDQLANAVAGRPVVKTPTFGAILYTKASLSQPGLVLGSKQASC